jgi:hypothetical protein
MTAFNPTAVRSRSESPPSVPLLPEESFIRPHSLPSRYGSYFYFQPERPFSVSAGGNFRPAQKNLLEGRHIHGTRRSRIRELELILRIYANEVKRMKSARLNIWLFLLLVSMSTAAAAAPAGQIEVFYNGQRLSLDTPPKNIQGIAFSSIGRNGLFDWIEATARYDPSDAGITIRRGGTTVLMHLGQLTARVGNASMTMPGAPMSLAGRIFVPLKFTCESLGLNVRADSSTGAILISSTSQSQPPLAIPANRPVHAIAPPPDAQSGWKAPVPREESSLPLKQPPPGPKGLPNSDLIVPKSLPDLDALTSMSSSPVGDSRPTITEVTHDAGGILVPGNRLNVTMKGTRNCQAFFGIEDLVQGIPMQEIQTGLYQGGLDIVAGPSIRDARLTGYLFQGKAQATPLAALATITIQGYMSRYIREVSHNASRPLSTGKTLKVTLTAKPGGQASFDIGDIAADIPMVEEAGGGGRYSGTYRVQEDDFAQKASITGHFNMPGEARESMTASKPVTLNSENFPMSVSSPTDSSAVKNPMQVIGQTLPGSRVTVHVLPQIGIFPQLINMGGDVCTTVTTSDSEGRFMANCQLPAASPGVRFKVKVWAQGASGIKSPVRNFEVYIQTNY